MLKSRHSLALLGLVLVLMLTAACGGGGSDEGILPPRPDEPAAVNGEYRADSVLHVAATGNPQLVEFFAYWCTVCGRMKPTVHELEAEYWGDIDFVYLDIDDPVNSPALEEFGFRAQPLFVLIGPDGEEIVRWHGATDADEFRDAFDAILAAT